MCSSDLEKQELVNGESYEDGDCEQRQKGHQVTNVGNFQHLRSNDARDSDGQRPECK